MGKRLKVDRKPDFHNGSFRFSKLSGVINTYYCYLNPRSNLDLVVLMQKVKEILNKRI